MIKAMQSATQKFIKPKRDLTYWINKSEGEKIGKEYGYTESTD